jgi:hypothetical protein
VKVEKAQNKNSKVPGNLNIVLTPHQEAIIGAAYGALGSESPGNTTLDKASIELSGTIASIDHWILFGPAMNRMHPMTCLFFGLIFLKLPLFWRIY